MEQINATFKISSATAMRAEPTAKSLPELAKTMPALQSIMDSSGMNVSFFARVAFIDSIKPDSWARVSML